MAIYTIAIELDYCNNYTSWNLGIHGNDVKLYLGENQSLLPT